MILSLRAGVTIVALIISAVIALTDVLPAPSAALLVATIVVTILLWFVLGAAGTESSLYISVGQHHSLSSDDVEDEYNTIVSRYGEDSLVLFTNMITNPEDYLNRISEHIEILGEMLQLRVTTRHTYEVGKSAPTVCLLPLTWVERDTLLESFAVTDRNNNLVTTLTYNRMHGLLVVAFKHVIKTAVRDVAGDRLPEEHRELIEEVSKKLVRTVCGLGSSKQLLASVKELPLPEDKQQEICEFCRQFVGWQLIVAEVRRVEMEEIVLTSSRHASLVNAASQRRNRWRANFGLQPSQLDIPLHQHAFVVAEYHQQIDAEPGQYVIDHSLERLDNGGPVTDTDLSVGHVRPHVRFANVGSPNAHLYIRRQGRPLLAPMNQPRPPRQLKSVVRLREIPPGVLGVATIFAFSTAVIISFVALTHFGLDVDATSVDLDVEQIKAQFSAAMSPLLLALPAFGGILISTWVDPSRIRRTSLTAYLALAGTMLLSLMSAVYFLFDASSRLSTSMVITVFGSVIITDWIWLALMAVTIACFLVLLRNLIAELRYYAKLVKHSIDRHL